MKSVAIIGSGITGLATAYRLNKLGVRVTVLEKKNTIGGGYSNYNRKWFCRRIWP